MTPGGASAKLIVTVPVRVPAREDTSTSSRPARAARSAEGRGRGAGGGTAPGRGIGSAGGLASFGGAGGPAIAYLPRSRASSSSPFPAARLRRGGRRAGGGLVRTSSISARISWTSLKER